MEIICWDSEMFLQIEHVSYIGNSWPLISYHSSYLKFLSHLVPSLYLYHCFITLAVHVITCVSQIANTDTATIHHSQASPPQSWGIQAPGQSLSPPSIIILLEDFKTHLGTICLSLLMLLKQNTINWAAWKQ